MSLSQNSDSLPSAIADIQRLPITAIVLAAGLSRRMGKKNKLLLKIDAQTLIEKVVANVLQSKAEEVIVVLGHEAVKVQHILKDKSVKMIKNAMYQLGMTTSIQEGVRAASKESKGYMIVLGDLVNIEVEELNLLIDTFQNSLEEKDENKVEVEMEENSEHQQIIENEKQNLFSPIVVPLFEGKRGNPVIFSHHYKEAILQHSNMNGCKGIIEANLDSVVTVEMPNNHVLKDIDTPEDYDLILGNL